MHWITLAIISAFFYAGYNFLIKISTAHIHEIAGAVILQISALAVGLLIFIILKVKSVPLEINSYGVWITIAAGVAVGVAEILSFYVFSQGVSAAKGIPVIIGGSVGIAALMGVFLLRESLSFMQWAGIILIVLGIFLLNQKTTV